MLKNRVIPVLLYDGFQCIKPVSFERPYRKLGSMDQYVRVMEGRNIDELIIIDVEATPNKREPNYVKIERYASNLFCPLTVGGGIHSLDNIKTLLANGADKICIKSRLEIVSRAAETFGKQAIVVCLEIYGHETEEEISEAAKHIERLGAGEILLICRTSDGTMEGYNLPCVDLVSSAVNIPVIAMGGCGTVSHMQDALDMGASAVAAGSIFLYTDSTPRECAEKLNRLGYNTRV